MILFEGLLYAQLEIAVIFFFGFSKQFGLKNFVFSMVCGGPGGYETVREVGRINFRPISPKSDLMEPSYDKKPKS